MSYFFTNGFTRKRTPARGKDGATSAQHSSGGKGDRSPSSVSRNIDCVGPEMAAGGSWIMFQDREAGPYWFNSRTGDWVCHTPIAPSFNYLVTTLPASSGQPLPTPGFPPPSNVTTPGLYPAAPQPWVVSPSPTSSEVVPLVPASSREKNTGKYNAWKKFTDEDGRAVWIHMVTGKRTLVDPYK